MEAAGCASAPAQRSGVQQRLEARHASREAKEKNNSNKSPKECTDSFTASFTAKKTLLEDSITALPSLDKAIVRGRIEELIAAVFALEKDAAAAAYYLPAYDQRSVGQATSKLKQQLEAMRQELVPAKKFSFSKKSVPTKPPAAAIAVQASAREAEQGAELGASDSGTAQAISRVDPARVVAGLRGQTVVRRLNGAGCGDFVLSQLHDCTVFLLGPLSALWLYKLTNCRVFCGPVAGATFADEVSGCTLALSSHQVRVHRATSCDMYLRVRSNPIIEHSSGLRVAGPSDFAYPGMDTLLQECGLAEVGDQWQGVQDFGWLRATPSPNWAFLPDEERAPAPQLPPSEDTC